MSQENVERVRWGQEQFSRGDLGAMRSLLSEQVEWESVDAFPGLEDVYRGPDAVGAWMDAVRSSFDDFDVSLESIIRDLDDLLVVVERLQAHGRESGAAVKMRIFTVYWFEHDKIVRRRAFVTEDEALEAAGLRD